MLSALPARLAAVLPPGLAGDARAVALCADFAPARAYAPDLASRLLEVASGVGAAPWELRRLAALMLQSQVLRIPVADREALAALLSRLGLLAAGGVLRESVLAEGYTTRELGGFARELRRRLSRARRVLRPLRGEGTSRRAWQGFLAYARREHKLVLARYLFNPRQVAARILGELRSSRGVEHPFAAGRNVVREETARLRASLPAYEAAILDHLCASADIRWIGDRTPAELGALVEAPLSTVVVVAKLPGSDWELEWKRCGRPGDHPVDVVFRRRGQPVPTSHRFDAGSMGTSLQWEAIATSTLARLHRAVHGGEPPVSRVVAMSSIRNVPAGCREGEVNLLDYLTDRRCFGRGFQRMRRAMAESVAAFELESGDELAGLPGELGLTVRFLHKIAPAQALLCGTSSLRLDRIALYLSRAGPRRYLGRPAHPAEARELADEVLEAVLGEYVPPRGRYRDPARYVAVALAAPASRARADRVYLGLMRQIGSFWGVLAGAKGYSMGESFVARNVGLRSVWRGGRWEVEIVFMDHDNLHVGGQAGGDFHPVSTTAGMEADESFIMGSRSGPSSVRGEVDYLDAIYRAGRPLARRGRQELLAALAAACRKTRRELAGPALSELFCKEYVRRVRDWDALLADFVRSAPAARAAGLRARAARCLAPRGHEPSFIDECAEALAEHGPFLRRYAFLYS